MKPLAKSLREANRYILFQVHSDSAISFGDFEKAVFETFAEWIGKFHLATYDVQFVKDRYTFPYGVIATNAKGLKEVRAALLLVEKVGKIPISVQTILTSGTLVKVKDKLAELQ